MKEKIKELYIIGHKPEEIGKELNCNNVEIRKCINGNFRGLKEEHKKNYKNRTVVAQKLKEILTY